MNCYRCKTALSKEINGIKIDTNYYMCEKCHIKYHGGKVWKKLLIF